MLRNFARLKKNLTIKVKISDETSFLYSYQPLCPIFLGRYNSGVKEYSIFKSGKVILQYLL